MRKVIRLSFIVFVSAFAAGCSSEKRPDGLPELIPTVIKVTQGGAPLEGASISLVPQAADNSPLGQWRLHRYEWRGDYPNLRSLSRRASG